MSEGEGEIPVSQPERRLSYTERYGADYGQPQGAPSASGETLAAGGLDGYVPQRATWTGTPHPKATTALVLGILGVTLCGICAPFAWVIGGRAVRDIDYSRGRLSGRGSAQAGRILGIIGTVLIVIGFIGGILLVSYAASHPTQPQPHPYGG